MSNGDKDSRLEKIAKFLGFIVAIVGTPLACSGLVSQIWPELLFFCAPAWQKHASWFLTFIVWALLLAAALRILFERGWGIVIGGGVILIILILLGWGWAWLPEYKSRKELRTHTIAVLIAEFGETINERHMTGRVREGLSSNLSGLREFAMAPLCCIFHPNEEDKVEDVVRTFQPAILVYGWRDEKGAHTRLKLDVEKLRLDEIVDEIRKQHFLNLKKYEEENAQAMALPVTPKFALRFLKTKEKVVPVIEHQVISICEQCTVLFTSGIAFHMAGEHDIAQQLFEQAVDPCPNPELVGTWRAIQYAALGSLDQSIDVFEGVVQSNPDRVVAWETLADLQLIALRYTEAQNTLKTLVEYLPEDAMIHYKLGYAHFAQRETKQAIEAWETALKLNPDFQTEADLNTNLDLAREIRDQEIERLYYRYTPTPSVPSVKEQAVKEQEDGENILRIIGLYHLGNNFYHNGQFDLASQMYITLLEEYKSFLPQEVEAQVRQNLSFSLVRQHKWEEAEWTLEPLDWQLSDYLLLPSFKQEQYKELYGGELWVDLSSHYEIGLLPGVQKTLPKVMEPVPYLQPPIQLISP